MSVIETTPRFMRPSDLGRTRRNRRQLQARKILLIAANIVLLAAVALSCLWLFRRTQEDLRFAVKDVQTVGESAPRKAALDALTRRYIGANLFKLDIAAVRGDFNSLPWIEHIAVEKKLPDTLVIRVFERRAVALVQKGAALHYVDAAGVVFDELSPRLGDDDLPLVTSEAPEDITRCVRFLDITRLKQTALYSRISEVAVVDVDSLRVFDRALRTFVYLDDTGSLEKWKTLYQLVAVEQFEAQSVDYADLRFRDRIVLRPNGSAGRAVSPDIENSTKQLSTQIIAGLGAAAVSGPVD